MMNELEQKQSEKKIGYHFYKRIYDCFGCFIFIYESLVSINEYFREKSQTV